MSLRMGGRRALILVVVAWMLATWGGRDLFHSHRDLSTHHDCPACRVERTAGVTAPVSAALVAIPVPVVVEVLSDRSEQVPPASGTHLEPPPRSPPLAS